MSYSPNLRRFKAFLDALHKNLLRHKIILSKLNHLTLNLQDEWILEELEQLLTIYPYLKYLILKLRAKIEKKIMFEPIAWQRLIDNQLPYLIFLRLHLNYIIVYSDTKDYNFQEAFNHAEYWLRRQPNFYVIINKIQRVR
ncbi:unnamed protein product [Rotaria sp. Silwood2]|nr:unnamed protein product [Rotaria sp. Silwood2]